MSSNRYIGDKLSLSGDMYGLGLVFSVKISDTPNPK